LQKLLGDLADLDAITKTDEFFQSNELKSQNKIEIKKK